MHVTALRSAWRDRLSVKSTSGHFEPKSREIHRDTHRCILDFARRDVRLHTLTQAWPATQRDWRPMHPAFRGQDGNMPKAPVRLRAASVRALGTSMLETKFTIVSNPLFFRASPSGGRVSGADFRSHPQHDDSADDGHDDSCRVKHGPFGWFAKQPCDEPADIRANDSQYAGHENAHVLCTGKNKARKRTNDDADEEHPNKMEHVFLLICAVTIMRLLES